MADEEHVVVYRAVADFTNLNTEAAKAEQAIKRLGDTHATANEKIAASEGKVGKSLDERVKANERVGQSEAKLAKDIEAHQKAQRALAEQYHKHAGQSSPLQLDPKKIDEQRQALAKLREELAGAQHYLRSSQFDVEQSQKLLKTQQGRVRRASDPRVRDIEQQSIPHFEERVGIAKAHVAEAEQRLSVLHARTQRGAESPTSTAAWQSMVRAEQAASTAAATAAAGRAEAAAQRAEAAAHQVRSIKTKDLKPGMIFAPGTGRESEITRVASGDGDATQIDLANGKTVYRKYSARQRVAVPVQPAPAPTPEPSAAQAQTDLLGEIADAQASASQAIKTAGQEARAQLTEEKREQVEKILRDAPAKTQAEVSYSIGIRQGLGEGRDPEKLARSLRSRADMVEADNKRRHGEHQLVPPVAGSYRQAADLLHPKPASVSIKLPEIDDDEFNARVAALKKHTEFGENYRRAVVDSLTTAHNQRRAGYTGFLGLVEAEVGAGLRPREDLARAGSGEYLPPPETPVPEPVAGATPEATTPEQAKRTRRKPAKAAPPAVEVAPEPVMEVTPPPATPAPRRPAAKRADYRRLRSVDEDALVTALAHADETNDDEEYGRVSRALDAKLRARERAQRAAQSTPKAIAAAEEGAHAEKARRRADNSPEHYQRLGLVSPKALETAFSFMSEHGDVEQSIKLLDGLDRADRVQKQHAKRDAFLTGFHAEQQTQFNQAEAATNGYMVNKRGTAKGVTNEALFYGPKDRIDRYASDELAEFFDKTPRLTLRDYYKGMRDRRPETPKGAAPATPPATPPAAPPAPEKAALPAFDPNVPLDDTSARQLAERHAFTDFAKTGTADDSLTGRVEKALRQVYANSHEPPKGVTRNQEHAELKALLGYIEAVKPKAAPKPEPEINADDYITVIEPVIEDVVAKAVEAKETRQRARGVTPADIARRTRRVAPAADIGGEATGKAGGVDELTDAEARQEAGSHKLAAAMARATEGLHAQREATARKVPVVGDLVDAEARETAGNRHLADAIREVVLAKQRHEIADKRLQQIIDTGTTKDIRRAQLSERAASRNLQRAESELRAERELLGAQQRKDFKTGGEDDRAIASHIEEQYRRTDIHTRREGRLDAAETRRDAAHQQELVKKDQSDAAKVADFVARSLEEVRKLSARADDEQQKAHTRRLANAKKEADDHLLLEQLEMRTAKMRHDHATQRMVDELKVGVVRAGEARREAEEVRRSERHTAGMELSRVRLAAARPKNSGSIWRRGGGHRDRTNLGVVKTATGMVAAGKMLAEGWRSTEASGRLLERTIARLNGAWRSYQTQTAASGDGGLIAGRGMKTVADWGDRLTSSFGRMLPKLLSFRAVIVLALAALAPLVASLGAVGAGAIGVVSAIGGLAAVVLALPSAFIAAASAIGALVLAFQPIAGVFQAYNAYQDATRQGSLQLADSQRQAARQMADAQHAVQQASIGLQQAQFNERRAQVALNEARRQAARDLQDLRAEMDRANLNEEGAVLALRRAEAEYRKVLADGNATQLDREEALNRVKNAEFDLRDVRLKNQRLAEDAAIAERRGVDGSLQVVDARNAAENATQNVAEAVYALAKAQQDAAQAARESAAGGSAAYSAYAKLQDELNKLGPKTREFVLGLLGMGGALRKLKQNVGDAFFGPLVAQLGNIKSLLDPNGGIAYLLNTTAAAMGNVAANAVVMVKGWQDSGDLKKIADSNATSVGNLGNAALYVASALERIAVISGPFLEWLTGAVERVAARFDKWTASASGVDTINRLLGIAKTRLQEFWDIAGNVFSLLGSLFFGSQQFTTDMMGGITKVTEGWAKWGKEQEKPNSSFQNFLKNTKPLLKDIVDFVGAFAKAFGTLAADPKNIEEAQRVFKTLANDVLPALVGIFTKLSESKAFSKIVAGLGDLFTAVDKFLGNGGITPLQTFIDTLLTAFTKLFDLLGNKAFGKALSFILTGLAALAAVSVVLKVTGLSKVIGHLDTVGKVIGTTIGLVGKLGGAFGGLAFRGLDRLSGGRLGRARDAAGRGLGRTRDRMDSARDRVLRRAPGTTYDRRQARRDRKATQGGLRDRVTDRVTGRRPGATRQQRSLRTPEARSTAVLAKLDTANGLLRRIATNTAGGSGGGVGGRGRRGPSSPTGGGPRGGRPLGGRTRRSDFGSVDARNNYIRRRTGQPGNASALNDRLNRRRADIETRRRSLDGVLRPRVTRVDTDFDRSATAIPGYSSQYARDYHRDYRRRRAVNDPILDLEEQPSGGARGWRGRAMDRRPVRGHTIDPASVDWRRRAPAVPDVEPDRTPVARNTPAYRDLTPAARQQVRRRDQRTSRRQRDQTQRRAQADQVRADRLRRRALGGIDEANAGLIGGTSRMLRGTGRRSASVRDRIRSGASRTTGFLRGIGQGAASRFRRAPGGDPERLRRRALDGIDETNTRLTGGVGGMLNRARDRRIERSAALEDSANETRTSRPRGLLRSVGARAADRYRRVRGDDPERGALDLGALRRRRAASDESAPRRRLRRPSVGGAVGAAGLALGGYAMWDMWFGGDDAEPVLDENGNPVEQPGGGGMLAAVGGLGGAAFLGLDMLDMGMGVADLFGGRGGEEDGTPDDRRSRRQQRREARRQQSRPPRRPAPAPGAGRRAGGRVGRLGSVGRLAGRAGGSVGRLAGRFGGRAAGFGGRLLRGGGPLGIVGAVAGLAADSGLLGNAGSLGKQLGQLGGAAAAGAGIGATVGSVVPGIGTGIGAAVGAVAGAGYSLFKDTGLQERIGKLTSSAGHWVSEEIGKPVGKFFSGIGRSIGNAANSAGRWIKEHVADPVSGFFRSIGRWFDQHVIRPVRTAISGVLDWLKPFWEIFKGIGLFLADMNAKAVGWVNDHVIQPVINFFVGVGQWVAERAKALGTWVEDHLITPVVNFFVGVGQWVADRARSIGAWIENNVISPVVNFFASIGRWVGARVSAIGSWVEGHVVNPVVNFFASIGRWVGGLPGRVGGWVNDHIVTPFMNFLSSVMGAITKAPHRIQHWAHNLPGMSSFIDDAPKGSYASGGEIAGSKDGRVDNLNIWATAGEFMVRKREVDRPGMRAHLDAINNGRFDPSAFYAGLNANVSAAAMPVNVPVRAVASSTTITNTNTRNAGLNIGDVTINNPVRERSDRSLRRSLQTLAYMQDR